MATTPQANALELEAVLDRYEMPLVRYAQRLTGDLDTARDVCQDVFLRLLAQKSPPPEDRLAAWLYTVCRNRAIDVIRRRRTARRFQRPGWHAAVDDGGLEATDGADPHLLAAVAELPVLQQEALWLKFVDGLSYAQIGTVLDKSPGHVGVIIHDAMVTLRKVLAPAAVPTDATGGDGA
jgi:RNA polymerase sigma factor (sigma-70 family)